MTQVDWLIIGAGVAGCRMAHLLSSQGYSVVILEKSRGLGGRLCHRRTEFGRFLHGAQYINIRSTLVRDILTPWLVEPHSVSLSRLGVLNRNGWSPAFEGSRFRFFPETSVFCKVWTRNSIVHLQSRVSALQKNQQGWRVSTDKRVIQADNLVSAIPFSQLTALLPEEVANSVQQSIEVTESPSCSVLFRTKSPMVISAKWNSALFPESIVRGLFQQPKNEGLNWTAILDGDWVEQHWKESEDVVIQIVLQELQELIGWSIKVDDIEWLNVHWWKYAFSQSQRITKHYFPSEQLCIIGDGTVPFAKGLEAAIISAEQALLEIS